MRMLVVDDFGDLRKFILSAVKFFAEREGLELEAFDAEGPEEALALIGSHGFDLIISDFDMGQSRMNGIQLAFEISKRSRDAMPTFVLMSAEDLSMEDIKETPIKYFLHKPFSLEQLESVVTGFEMLGKG